MDPRPPSDQLVPLPVAAGAPPLRPVLCPLCGFAGAALLRRDSRCSQCEAPLAPPLPPGQQERGGRRGAVRRDQSHVAALQLGWPGPRVPVRWRDLSLTGLSVYANVPVAVATRVHLVDAALEAVAEVVACRRDGRMHLVHARLLTVLFLQSSGVFVSATA